MKWLGIALLLLSGPLAVAISGPYGAPEIDPASIATGMTILAGSVLILADRYRLRH